MTSTRRSGIVDPYDVGMTSGWKVIDASLLTQDVTLDADVAIVGSGAGGGTSAEILANAGLNVVVLEEGPLKTSNDFHMREAEAYPELYQESAARKTRDKAINILQGRCVGGGTTVNWTSSFRTPPATLAYWQRELGLPGFGVDDMAPWFAQMESRLSIAPWEVAPNANNGALARGARNIGISWGVIRRNVKGCWNLGYCGMGCPTNAKQSMLVTTIPGALASGATLVTRLRVHRFVLGADRVTQVEGHAMDARGIAPTTRRVLVRAKVFIAAGGAIGTPALLLRSGAPDPHGILGKRTFLHPTVVSAALMPERIDGFAGAPQTIFSDHFLETQPIDGAMGFKLEAPPLHPVLTAITLPEDGAAHARWMQEFPRMHVLIALMRDGFHPESQGGTVRLRDDGTPLLDYPLSPMFWDAARRALRAMAEIQFAAGAQTIMPVHGQGASFSTLADASAAIDAFALQPVVTPVVSAHVMGGAPLGVEAARAVVTTTGRHHQIENLYVFDGSLFPTSIGANPQLSIYGIVARLATGLAQDMAPRR
ncbi:MAG: GMC family oxidoreductase [Betaproteobacteria bacterium]